VNERSGVASDLANEFLEGPVVQCPCFDLGDQIHRHIERARAALLLEGQVPAGLGAASSFEGRKAAFDKRAQLGDLAQSGIASFGVPVRGR